MNCSHKLQAESKTIENTEVEGLLQLTGKGRADNELLFDSVKTSHFQNLYKVQFQEDISRPKQAHQIQR